MGMHVALWTQIWRGLSNHPGQGCWLCWVEKQWVQIQGHDDGGGG